MENYANVSRKSSVAKYKIGVGYIIIEFKTGPYRFYKYTYQSTGQSQVENMNMLAMKGVGLNSYIDNPAIRKTYAKKSRTLKGLE